MHTTNKSKNYIDLLPDELVYLILEHRLFVHYDTFSRRRPTHLLKHRAKLKALSLVCRRWRRIIKPISYDTVIITSIPEANALAFKLRQRHQRIGCCIKRLRIERGQGRAIYTILSKVPRLISLCITFNDISKRNAGSLCRGLKLVNPKHLVLRDLEYLGNQGTKRVMNVLIECMTSIWSNLVLYDHPYNKFDWGDYPDSPSQCRASKDRNKALSRSLAYIPNLQTVYVPRVCYSGSKDNIITNAFKRPSLKRIYCRLGWRHVFLRDLEEGTKIFPRFGEIVHLPLSESWRPHTPLQVLDYAPIGDRTISEIQETFVYLNRDPNYG